VLVEERAAADYFEEAARVSGNSKAAANWTLTEILRLVKEGADFSSLKVPARHLGEMILLIDDDIISGKIAKEVFEEMSRTGKDPAAIVRERGLVQIVDEAAILAVIDQVLAENPGPLAQYRGGKTATLGFFVGQAMRKTQGKANPQKLNELLKKRLDG
jgi:aspartyl-tRNA(Asn)/glutamyl-tRNA(Gln) amidotransferase subunit B